MQSGSRYKGYNIKNFNLDPSSSRRLQTVDVDDQTDDIFSYVVEFEADQVSGASQRDAQINALVTATMTSGSFAATLADNSPAAFANAEPEMVSQSSIMINDATPIPVIPSGGSDDKYSKGDIAGIVIGTVLGTALLVGRKSSFCFVLFCLSWNCESLISHSIELYQILSIVLKTDLRQISKI